MDDTGSNSVLLTELVSSEGLLIPTLRAVYESNKHETFKEELDTFINNTDNEIEQICSFHHMGFMESIDELLKVKGKAQNVRSRIDEFDTSIDKAGNEMTRRAEQLRENRIQLRNIYTGIENLYQCLPVLQLYRKSVKHLNEKRYYAALKALDQVESSHMAAVRKYSFAQLMHEKIPLVRSHIKTVVLKEMQDWLTDIVGEAKVMGKVALDQTRQLQAQTSDEVFSVDTLNWKESDVVLRRRSMGRKSITGEGDRGSSKSKEIEDGDGNAEAKGKPRRKKAGSVKERLSMVDNVVDRVSRTDFSPIYRCLHIYEVLGHREEFEQYYKSSRKHQLSVVLQPLSQVTSLLGENLSTYQTYFHEIVGFFIVEDTVHSTTRRFLSRSVVEDLWEVAVSKISSVLKMQAGYCKDANVLLQVKEFLVLFCHTLTEYGFGVSRLYDLLLDLRERYNTVLMQEWAVYFTNHFVQDNYQPIVVQNEDEYMAIQAMYPFREIDENGVETVEGDAESKDISYPYTLKFSVSVPYVYKDIKEFIAACKVYAENINMSHTEVDDAVRKSANILMSKTLNEVMNKVITSKSLTLSQLVQISVNVTFLESTCENLEEFIALITHTASGAISSSKLYGSEIFREGAHLC